MGIIGSIGGFFGGDEKEDAADRQYGRMSAHRRQALATWGRSMDFLRDQYKKSGKEYTANYKKTLSDYSGMVRSARSRMESGFGREMSYHSEGKENTLQQVQQSYERTRGQTMAGNIMSGLAGTSFGSGQQASLNLEEAQQLGNVETAYAQRFASTEARHTQQRREFDFANISGRTALSSGYAQGRLGLQTGFTKMLSDGYARGMSAQQGWGAMMQGAGAGQMAAEQASVTQGQGIVGNILGGLF